MKFDSNQIFPLHDAEGSQLWPLHFAAGSQSLRCKMQQGVKLMIVAEIFLLHHAGVESNLPAASSSRE
jgi:hypothetical protein